MSIATACALSVVSAYLWASGPLVVPDVDVVSVDGGQLDHADPGSVADAVGVDPGVAWWSVQWGPVDRDIPAVRQATVVATLDGAAVVVTERVPVLVATYAGVEVVVDGDGVAVGPAGPDAGDLPRIEDLAGSLLLPGQVADHPAATAAALVAADGGWLSDRADSVGVGPAGDVVVDVAGVTVVFGDATAAEEKVAAARVVLDAGVPAGAQLDVRAPSAPTVRGAAIDPVSGGLVPAGVPTA